MANIYSLDEWFNNIDESDLSSEKKELRKRDVAIAFKNEVPVIIDIDHFASLLGIKKGVLSNMIHAPNKFYREFSIPKKLGGSRKIETPHKSLLEVQRWIIRYILSKFSIHDAAFAYVKKRNAILNAGNHINSNEAFIIDLYNFFPANLASKVRQIFSSVGYNKDISFFLTNLCCLNGSIPQGAASSPIISNILFFDLDRKLTEASNSLNIKYSRYADDLAFSGESISKDFKKDVYSIIEDGGFLVNQDKIRQYVDGQPKIVTGIVVGSKLRLPKKKRRLIKQQVHYILKYGVLNNIKRYNDLFYIDRVLGKLNFWRQVEPDNPYVTKSISQIKSMFSEVLKKERG
ncbi:MULTISPECIES: reverse transcriptase domain-containing protein [unclassified Robiginitalea]|uniref:reverse transcriptase domain-containing protein n=1 Tax=Robiginitalea TaxID=252306 RepID=UPI00234AD3C7|nr:MULTISPECIES: reverse transcriptase domain-containing protein [unclassified Robiginitalea]MDC6353283.1 reverse transcriptase domain-containing protein [Robiginitalea sp. PM2]MDC6373551.1 reverse transcriptase domain-containing protein [Robiginitalea sp. SP8]